MRIHATGAAALAAPAVSSRRVGRGGFSVADADTARAPAQSAAPRAVATLDALIALQAFDDPGERRRRTVKRGRTALDALDEIKIGVIGGTLDPATLARLKAVAASLGERSGDAGLDSVMAEIELRAAVELAKFGQG
jgi:hypothetical protein